MLLVQYQPLVFDSNFEEVTQALSRFECRLSNFFLVEYYYNYIILLYILYILLLSFECLSTSPSVFQKGILLILIHRGALKYSNEGQKHG